jgi:hypothetical protein
MADPPWNLGLKAALNQTTSPEGTDWLLNCVEKHTLKAHGVEVGVVEVVEVEVIVVVEGGAIVVVDVVLFKTVDVVLFKTVEVEV